MAGPIPSVVVNSTVVASPAAAAETIICTLAGVTVDSPSRRVDIEGWCAFVVGTNGTAVRIRIRQNSITGTVVGDTGSLTGGVAAANALAQVIECLDLPGDVAAFTYHMTMVVTAASAGTAVSGAKLRAIIF